MKKLLLHIGLPKTGTSSIQETLSRAATAGQLHDVVYPHLGERDHYFIAALYQSHDRLPRTIRHQRTSLGTAFDRRLEKFRNGLFLAIENYPRIIISAESLAHFSPSEATALRDDFVRLGATEVCVLAYVREPASLYLSNIQQQLKASHEFISPDRFHYSYAQRLNTWKQLFRVVRIRPYNKSQLHEGDVVRDAILNASNFFGREIANADLPISNINESISAEGMILLQRYRTRHHANESDVPTRDTQSLVRLLQSSTATIKQTAPRLKETIATLLKSRHARDLERLRRDFDVDLRDTRDENPHRVQPETEAGIRHTSRVQDILDSYDEEIIDQLESYCLHKSLLDCKSTPPPV